MKKLIKRLFNWLFQEEIKSIQTNALKFKLTLSSIELLKKDLDDVAFKIRLEHDKAVSLSSEVKKDRYAIEDVFKNIDTSIDIDYAGKGHSRSWAIVSVRGKKEDSVMFFDFDNVPISYLEPFIRDCQRISNIKIDASRQMIGIFNEKGITRFKR